MLILLNNPAGIDVIPVLENVLANIAVVLVAELVLILLNNPAGIDVIPVPKNVMENILLVLVAELVLILLNNPAGISVIPVLENVSENILLVSVAELVSIPLNNPAGISVNDLQPKNVRKNKGAWFPNCGNIAPNTPEIEAIVQPPLKDIDIEADNPYFVATPPKRIVCSPAVSHVQVYVVESVDVRLMVLP